MTNLLFDPRSFRKKFAGVLGMGKSGQSVARLLAKKGFKVLGSDRRSLPVHYADTVLLTPKETVDVAFVADNPGDWMLHCHIIEHQEAGMMGYLRVA